MKLFKPVNEMGRKKADGSFAAHDSAVDVVVNRIAGDKISGRVTNAVSTLLK